MDMLHSRPLAKGQHGRPRRVLVVDDDALVRATVERQLEAAGWEVTTTAGTSEAREALLFDDLISVMVCDVHLHAESGFVLAEQLADLRPENLATEIIFLTGNATSDTAIAALRHRAFDLIRKPYRRQELTQRVEAAALSAARRRRQAALLERLRRRVDEGEAQKRRLATSLRKAEDQNRALEESAGEARHCLLSVISHELKTPLIPIVGLADIMLNSEGLRETDLREYAALIREGGERLGTIIDRTLDYLDAERQFALAEKHHFAVTELIEAAFGEVPRPDYSPAVEIDCPPVLSGWGTPKLLAHALAELIDNAMKAAPADDFVHVQALRLDAERIAVDVRDSGAGLPDHVRMNLGVPFLPGDATTTRRWTGVGIGLARAMKIVRLNGGELIVCETRTGEGAHLRLVVPAQRS
jgi:signal transduction histidine kinase